MLSCRLNIFLKPNSNKNKIELDNNDVIKVWVKSPPQEGKANCELIEFLSNLLKIPKSYISIKVGTASKRKIIEITGKNKEEILEILKDTSKKDS
jgi:uncharacterized protein (TIGR00251 family)